MSCEKVNDKSGEAQSAEVEVQDGAKYVDFDISTSSVAFSLNIEELSLSLVCDNFTDETTVRLKTLDPLRSTANKQVVR